MEARQWPTVGQHLTYHAKEQEYKTWVRHLSGADPGILKGGGVQQNFVQKGGSSGI
jgi:hypothetical protein